MTIVQVPAALVRDGEQFVSEELVLMLYSTEIAEKIKSVINVIEDSIKEYKSLTT